jgi:hypothetical protein
MGDEKRGLQTDERLNDETGKGSSDKDEGHERSREAERDEVWRSCRTSCVIQCLGRVSLS